MTALPHKPPPQSAPRPRAVPAYRARIFVFATLAAFAVLLVVSVVRDYLARPFFANSFTPIAGWSRTGNAGGYKDMIIDYDPHERVLLLTRIESNHNVEWLIDTQRVGNRLRIRRQDDNLIRDIEWRRDCVIVLDHEGLATYFSLPVGEFENALLNPRTGIQAMKDIVMKVLRERP